MNKKLIFLLSILMCAAFAINSIAAPNESVQAEDEAPVLKGIDFSMGLVIADFLNIRQGPSTDHDVIEVLKSGDTVRVIGQIGEWYAVYNEKTGNIGTVNSNYIAIEQVQAESTEIKKDNTKQPDNNPKNNVNVEEDEPVIKKLKLTKDQQTLLDLVNAEREKNDLQPLAVSDVLMETAKLKAQDMAENNYFSHQSPKYGSPFDMMKNNNLQFNFAGENIAGNKTVEGAFKAWMKKEGNKSNILNPQYKYIGIGISDSDKYGKIFVQQFIGE